MRRVFHAVRLRICKHWVCLFVAAFVLLSFGGCISRCKYCKIKLGSAADIKTPEGDQFGFLIRKKCEVPEKALILCIMGRGERWFGGVSPKDKGRKEARQDLKETLYAILKKKKIQLGMGLRNKGIAVFIVHWREVDKAVKLIGNYIEKEKLKETVLLFKTKHPLVIQSKRFKQSI